MKLHDRVKSDVVLPARASVVVIGAGIIGISTALELAERGVDVVVVEKGEVAGEQSSRNWGWCRQMGRDPREIPLMIESLRLWRGMNARLNGETGFKQCGVIYLAETEKQLADHEKWLTAWGQPNGIPTRMVNGTDVDTLLPGGVKRWAGGMYTINDGRAEPFIAVPAMARALQAQGGKIFTQCAARGVEMQAGRVVSVVTEHGYIATDSVVLAGGYWSRRFLNNLGLRFPQLGVISSVLRTSPLDVGIDRTFAGGLSAVRKRMDGGFTLAHNAVSVADITPASFVHFRDFLPVLRLERKSLRLRLGRRFFEEARMKRRWALDQVSPFEQVRILDPEPIGHLLDEAFSYLKSRYPAFENVTVVETWAGMIDATPDAVPVIDKIDDVPGLHLASGFSGHGFGIGPGAGKLMAEIVTGETPCVDPKPFRFARFSDGSRPRPTTGL
jgi:glycine/D-amino acid oxidase-like deaminating enzyme